MEKIKDIDPGKDWEEMAKQMKDSGGFVAKKFGLGIEIMEKMEKDECTKFLSFPACLVSTGCRGIIKEILKNKMTDVVITTCGTMDHDLARVWSSYFHGSFGQTTKSCTKKALTGKEIFSSRTKVTA